MARDSLLIIIEKYDGFVNYIYPIIQNVPRKHGTVKEMMTQSIFIQTELFYKALKSDSKSKLHEADANLAMIRYWMRFMANEKRKPINFLGYRITAGYKLIRKDSVVRAKRKIKLYTKHGEFEKLALFMASWRGHIRSADSKNLQTNIERMIDGYKCT